MKFGSLYLAKFLHNCQIGEEVSEIIDVNAINNGLVIVYGASDDRIEFRGVIYSEVGVCDGSNVYLTNNGLVLNLCDDPECPYYLINTMKATFIKALWCATDEYSWTYETEIPHRTFDILKGDEKYCQGIVFSLADVK